jgi:hypothetical protein
MMRASPPFDLYRIARTRVRTQENERRRFLYPYRGSLGYCGMIYSGHGFRGLCSALVL